MGNRMPTVHFDPLNAVLILIAIIAGYRAFISRETALEKDNAWHSEWIKKHSTECDQRERAYMGILAELKAGNAHLTTLTEGHGERLSRIENNLDKKR